MQFARPPEGFILEIGEPLELKVAHWAGNDPTRRRAWDSVKARLKFVAAREGTDLGRNRFAIVFRDVAHPGDTIRLAYEIERTTVTVIGVDCRP